MKVNKLVNSGFTLIELLIVIAIIGIITGLSIFGLQGFRESTRDARRKSDIQTIRSGLELYKADCGSYPTTVEWSSAVSSGSLRGRGTPSACAATNIYINSIPTDPLAPARGYFFSSAVTTYMVCAGMEVSGTGSTTGCGFCGSGVTCNYKEINP